MDSSLFQFMYHKQIFRAVITASLFFLFTCQKGIAASRKITTLKLNFLRTEELISSSQSSTMSGTIIYNKNPFLFIFELKEPAAQTMYINSRGAWIIDSGELYDFEENRDFLEQTCRDFLNWFKEDYGLAESGFKAQDRWVEEKSLVSQWDCYKFEDQPLNKVLVYSDSLGRFTRLKMFANEDELVTDTKLSAFQNSGGCSYPTYIDSVSYDGQEAFLKTLLKFSDISFSPGKDDLAKIDKFTKDSPKTLPEYPKADLSDFYQVITAHSPQALSYKVSLPSVITGASFRFYKNFITSQDMSNCPFYPSCSQFMLEAVQANGVAGLFQGLERLKRCTSTEHKRDQYPTLSNGKHYDPVPVKEKK